MIFVKLGKLIAAALVILGGLQVGLGFWIAYTTPTMEENAALAARYLAAETTGDAIDSGFIMVAIGVGFGLLAKIAGRS